VSLRKDLTAILPGLAFAVGLAVVAKAASWFSGGAVSAVFCAIVLGILWRGLAGIGDWAERGLEFAASTLLRIGIALVGLRLTLGVLADTSAIAVPLVLACITVAMLAALGFGRLLGVTPGMRQLLAAGTAICGCTAIIAIAPLLRARKAEIGIALACVVMFGSAAMMIYPWIAGLVFGDSTVPAGMFFGSSIQDTSQVVGAALIYGEQFDAPDAVAIAGLTKFLRTLGLLVLVPLAAWWGARGEATIPVDVARSVRREVVPTFVLCFIGLVILRTLGDSYAGDLMASWQAFLGISQSASEWLLLVGIAAVGLGVTVSHLREAGWRPICLAFVAALLTGAASLALLGAGS
jgi:uncharacterized integral membrane protein (TIGR00698 family)